MYHDHIHYAALSPDGNGLSSSYGPVAVRWKVETTYLGRRISLLEENSYTFYGHHNLGLSTDIPPGYRAIWEERTDLVAAKLAARLTSATSEAALSPLLFRPGATRKDDDYVEIAIYADTGIDTDDVDRVTVQRAPMNSEENHRCQLVREICAARCIALIE